MIFIVFNLSQWVHAQNSSSAEFQCRSKAKEIAADTYKTCMTDVRQTQLEQIRKDYKEKLAELKSHYDKELKKMGTGLGTGAGTSVKQVTRGSKLPAKKGQIQTQVIDLSSPDSDSVQANRLKIEQDEVNSVEVVELPPQE